MCGVCVCVLECVYRWCERERGGVSGVCESVCCVCERERESVCVCVRESVCVCVCVKCVL